MTKRAGQGLVALSAVSVLFAIASASMPAAAHAGVFSDVLSIFGKAAEASGSTEPSGNVQTMALAAPATNIDPNPSVGGGDITVVDSSAVLAADGPNGTSADIVAPESHQISTYIVRQGDTLSGIAEMFNVSVNTIRWSNDISKNGTIVPGQKLTILPISGITYTVKKGDTLASIAKAYDGDVTEVANYNSLDADATLSAGAKIIIPNGELASAPAVSAHVSSGASSGSTSNRVVLNNGTVIYEPAHDTNGPSYPGYYASPLSHYIETQGLHGYNAVDLAAPSGTPIMAAADGTVIISRAGGWNGGYGTYVVISHGNGTQTLYAHMSRDIIAVGDYVSQGEVIGYVGMTGEATGPHVHFEVRGAKNPLAE